MSTQGDVNITAGNKLHVGGADLIAQKDLNLTGDSVQIDPGYDERTRTETFETKQSGLTLALSGTVGGALNTAVSTAQQARKESDGRLSALQNTKAVLSGVQAQQAYELDGLKTEAANDYNTANNLKPGDKDFKEGSTNTIGISASYGSQSSKSETHTDSRQSQGSTLNAGQNLSITATGKNKNSNPDSGNITVAGSELKAGKDLSLSATQDINLVSAQNSEQTTSQNSSKGSSIGVGVGVGAGGYGVNVSASVNQGKGHEKGNGLTHTETTLDAGHKLTLNSGQDTTLKGAQVSGEQVTVNVGRDLILQSEQDSDRYDAKQQEVSVGGGYTIGGTPNINISASKDKIHSNYDSVKEQTGIFAGKGGFDVSVKEHTQLDGAVMASTADKDKNRLDTGTLGWKDIDNKADFTAEHTGGSMGTGGPIGSQLLTNAAGGLLSNANNSGQSEGTTKSAVSDGTIIVRHDDKQKQDVNTLNRDTDHANDGSINPIFDKEKEQNRLKQSQLIGEIGNQTMDIIRAEGEIAGYKAQKDPDALAAAKEQLEEKAKENNLSEAPTEAQIQQRAYDNAMAQYGTGSDVQKAAQAVTGLLQGLAGDNLAGALANASSPYLATLIKQQVGEENKAANAMAHAVLGAVVAELNNQSAAAGGLGAGGGELSAHVILNTLFPGKKVSDLSEKEKQQVSALSQLASGLAGGLTTGDVAGAVTAEQAGKNAVENNLMSAKPIIKGLEKGYESCMKNATCRNGLMQLGVNFGLTAAQIQEAMDAGIAARNGDIEAMRQLTPEQIAYIDERIINNQGPARLMFGEQTWGDRIWAESDRSADNENSTPNIGKGLTNEQKNELGGSSSGAPGGWEPQDEEYARNNERGSITVEDLTSTSSKGNATTGRSKLFERTGGNSAANKEFDALSPTDIKDIPGGRVGKLPDGRTVIVRERSTDGRPTLEIQSGKNRIKFRYDE